MLTKEAIDEYKALYKQHYGVDLSDAEASFRANNLLNLYRAVLLRETKEGAIHAVETETDHDPD